MTKPLPTLPVTHEQLVRELSACGLGAGQVVLVHSSLSRLGWVAGGAQTVIQALLEALTPTGTLLMPAHTPDNTDPARWENPPVPPAWWDTIRQHSPAFDPQRTPTSGIGVIPELFRTWPGVLRSSHPIGSFTAHGPAAEALTREHKLEEIFGERSPIGKLYALDGYVLLLGVGHENNTSLHLAEHRAHWPGRSHIREGTALLVEGRRQWVEYNQLDFETEDFAIIGAAFERERGLFRGKVGSATVRLMKQRPLVDFAVAWMETHRDFRPVEEIL
jgi:aminoglycoside 3-N-acetyltransferase